MIKLNKKILIENICSQLEKDKSVLTAAALATYDAATNEESKPENQYDTRALEASYLAGAQAERVRDIEEQLTVYKYLELKEFTDKTPISISALVEVSLNETKSLLFILPKGGGFSINFEGHHIKVVTPTSLLGESLLGLKVGDWALVESPKDQKEYEIISVQ